MMPASRLNRIGWSGVALAVVAFVMVVVNIALALVNSRTQSEISSRQELIATGPQINQVGEALVHSLMSTAESSNDGTLIAMMRNHGLTIPGQPNAGAASPKAARGGQ